MNHPIFIATVIAILLSFVSASSRAAIPSTEELQAQRNRIRAWAMDCCLRDGMTPWTVGKTRKDLGTTSSWNGNHIWERRPEDRGDGDSVLFSALLYSSGELWARNNIINSRDEQGGMWRSPYRVRSRSDGSWGNKRFSQDHMLGVLLFLVTEYKYHDKAFAKDFANKWGRWMLDHLSQGEFSLCRWDYSDPEALDSCALEGKVLSGREGLIRTVFNYVGANSPQRRTGSGWLTITQKRLGDGQDNGKKLETDLGVRCSLAPDRGKKFNCHLLAVTSLIMQEMGFDSNVRRGGRSGLDEGFRDDPFSVYVANGLNASDEFVVSRTYELCGNADKSYTDNTSRMNQWMFQRSGFERDAQNLSPSFHSYGFDCIYMLNKILNK